MMAMRMSTQLAVPSFILLRRGGGSLPLPPTGRFDVSTLNRLGNRGSLAGAPRVVGIYTRVRKVASRRTRSLLIVCGSASDDVTLTRERSSLIVTGCLTDNTTSSKYSLFHCIHDTWYYKLSNKKL